MGRSVSYLSNALRINYFNWPTFELEDGEVEYEDGESVIEDIRETIKSNHPEFEDADKWDGNETHIILEGYGLQIGLSEYCGGASLSVRVDNKFEDWADDEETDSAVAEAEQWVKDNWEEASKHWNEFKKVGTFSNGEGIYEKIK